MSKTYRFVEPVSGVCVCVCVCARVLSRSVISDSCNPIDQPARLLCPWASPGNTGVGCHFLLQVIFPTQESNPSLLHCRQILYQLSCEGSHIYIYMGIYIHKMYNFVQRREKKSCHLQFVSSCHLREKMSDSCSLFPPSGDPQPSCLLPSHPGGTKCAEMPDAGAVALLRVFF